MPFNSAGIKSGLKLMRSPGFGIGGNINAPVLAGKMVEACDCGIYNEEVIKETTRIAEQALRNSIQSFFI